MSELLKGQNTVEIFAIYLMESTNEQTVGIRVKKVKRRPPTYEISLNEELNTSRSKTLKRLKMDYETGSL